MSNVSIAVVVNPVKDRKRKKIVDQICRQLTQRKILFSVFDHTWPADINIYTEAWLIGGDGTLNYFLNLYRSIQIPVAIFKGGTCNDFSWKLYGNMSTSTQVEHVLKATAHYIDAALCNDRVFINGVGIGFDGEVVKSISTVRLLGKHLGYLWVVLRKIFSFRELNFKINFNGKFLDEKFLLVIITNSSRVGGGFLVAPSADIDDGKLDIMLCKPLPIVRRLINLPTIEKGKHLDKNFIIHNKIEEAHISCDSKVFAHIDGELVYDDTFNIAVLPHCYLLK